MDPRYFSSHSSSSSNAHSLPSYTPHSAAVDVNRSGGDNRNRSGGVGGNELDFNNSYLEFPATMDNYLNGSLDASNDFDGDMLLSTSGDGFWSRILQDFPAVDNNNQIGEYRPPPPPQQMPFPSSSTSMPPEISQQLNNFQQSEFPATNNGSLCIPVDGMCLGLLEHSPAVDNNNIQIGEYRPLQQQMALPSSSASTPPEISQQLNNFQQSEFPATNNGSLSIPVDGMCSGLLEHSPAVDNNNIQIGEYQPQMANVNNNSSDFNVSVSDTNLCSSDVAAPSILNIPIGFRFQPTDEELITHFLGPESSRSSSNAGRAIIKHANIYDYEPHQLQDLAYSYKYADGKMYFYTSIKKKGENKTERVVKSGDGYWRATQAPKPIRNENGHTIGTKTSITYMRYTEKNRAKGEKAPWLMYEYKLPPSQKSYQNSSEELVLVVVYYHKAKPKPNVV